VHYYMDGRDKIYVWMMSLKSMILLNFWNTQNLQQSSTSFQKFKFEQKTKMRYFLGYLNVHNSFESDIFWTMNQT
jgi:hypothetical protein